MACSPRSLRASLGQINVALPWPHSSALGRWEVIELSWKYLQTVHWNLKKVKCLGEWGSGSVFECRLYYIEIRAWRVIEPLWVLASAPVKQSNSHLAGVLWSLVICVWRAWPIVSSQCGVAIIRIGVSRVYLEVLGCYGQRSVRMSIEFYSVCSLSHSQNEDTGLYGPRTDCSSIGSFLISVLWLKVSIRNGRWEGVLLLTHLA